jgi:hypothetical protein
MFLSVKRILPMPLPCILNGTTQCTKLCKRTGIRCKNPCAYGSRVACKTHGSHRSRNVLRGKGHPRYLHGKRTKEAEAELRKKGVLLRYLVDLGNHSKLFYKEIKTRGRPPAGYERLDLTDQEQLALAILKTLPNK